MVRQKLKVLGRMLDNNVDKVTIEEGTSFGAIDPDLLSWIGKISSENDKSSSTNNDTENTENIENAEITKDIKNTVNEEKLNGDQNPSRSPLSKCKIIEDLEDETQIIDFTIQDQNEEDGNLVKYEIVKEEEKDDLLINDLINNDEIIEEGEAKDNVRDESKDDNLANYDETIKEERADLLINDLVNSDEFIEEKEAKDDKLIINDTKNDSSMNDLIVKDELDINDPFMDFGDFGDFDDFDEWVKSDDTLFPKAETKTCPENEITESNTNFNDDGNNLDDGINDINDVANNDPSYLEDLTMATAADHDHQTQTQFHNLNESGYDSYNNIVENGNDNNNDDEIEQSKCYWNSNNSDSFVHYLKFINNCVWPPRNIMESREFKFLIIKHYINNIDNVDVVDTEECKLDKIEENSFNPEIICQKLGFNSFEELCNNFLNSVPQNGFTTTTMTHKSNNNNTWNENRKEESNRKLKHKLDNYEVSQTLSPKKTKYYS